MKSHGFGNPCVNFSPYANHAKDHERILDIGYSELSKKMSQMEPNKSFGAFTCSKTNMPEPAKSFLDMKCSEVGTPA